MRTTGTRQDSAHKQRGTRGALGEAGKTLGGESALFGKV